MADANVASLCGQIVHAHFGPLAFVRLFQFSLLSVTLSCIQRVADSLLTRGRLSLAQIIRFTQLKPRTARACVLVLIQHNILWHATTLEEGEVLEVNVDECLTRLRFGRYVHQAQTLFGDAVIQSHVNTSNRNADQCGRRQKLFSSFSITENSPLPLFTPNFSSMTRKVQRISLPCPLLPHATFSLPASPSQTCHRPLP
jgi:hypothetical protein